MRKAPDRLRIADDLSCCEPLSERRQSCSNARFNCSQRLTCLCRNFGMRKPLKESKLQSPPLLRRQLLYCAANPGDCSIAIRGLFQIGIDRYHHIVDIRLWTPPAQLVDGAMTC